MPTPILGVHRQRSSTGRKGNCSGKSAKRQALQEGQKYLEEADGVDEKSFVNGTSMRSIALQFCRVCRIPLPGQSFRLWTIRIQSETPSDSGSEKKG